MPTKQQFKTLLKDSTAFCEDYRSSNIDVAMREADDAYHGVLENLADYEARGRSRLYIPKTQVQVDKWVKTFVNAFYLSDDIVTCLYPLDEGKERFTNEVLNRRIEAKTTFFMWLADFAHATVKYGNSVGKTGWDYSESSSTESQLDPDTGAMTNVTVTTPVVDKPFFEVVPFEQIQLDYRCTSIDPVQDSPFLRQWTPMLVTDVEARFASKEWRKPRGIDWDKLSEGPWTLDLVRKSRQGEMNDPAQTNVGSASDGPALSYRQVWVVENYFRSGGTDWTFISLGDEHIVTEPERVTDKFVHKKRPFSLTKFNPQSFRVVSPGLPKLMRGPQNETNAIRNQRRDNVSLCLNKQWLVKRGMGIQLSSLINSRPGATHLGDNISEESIREVPMTDVTASGYREEEINNRDIEEISGHSANTLGVSAPDRQTATASAIAASSAGEDESFRIKCFIETGVRPLLEMFYDNIVEMENDPDVLAFAAIQTGLPPDETLLVRGELVINAGMGATNKELRAGKYERGMDKCIQLAPVDPKFLGYADMIMKQWLPLMGIKNLELKNTQEAQPQAGAPGIPPGAEAEPSSAAPPAASPPQGISPEVTMEAASTPGMGGMARGLLQ
jgi:hypothetical protein